MLKTGHCSGRLLLQIGLYAKKGKEGKARTARKGWRESLCFRLGKKGKDSKERKVRTAR